MYATHALVVAARTQFLLDCMTGYSRVVGRFECCASLSYGNPCVEACFVSGVGRCGVTSLYVYFARSIYPKISLEMEKKAPAAAVRTLRTLDA